MAVVRALSLSRSERILGYLLGRPGEFGLVRFQNQPSRGAPGVPDYEIACNCRILVETKVRRNAVDREQIARHLERLDGTRACDREQYMLLLTPDSTNPVGSEEGRDPRLTWASFAMLDQTIDEMMDDRCWGHIGEGSLPTPRTAEDAIQRGAGPAAKGHRSSRSPARMAPLSAVAGLYMPASRLFRSSRSGGGPVSL